MLSVIIPKTQKVNLLDIEQLTNQEWFASFMELEDPLSKCLVLVALMSERELITNKEAD